MHAFSHGTLDDLLRDALNTLIAHGDVVDPPPKRGKCRELRAVTLQLSNPRARISRSGSRGKLFSALGELGWYLSGSNDTHHIAYYIPDYAQDDEDDIIHGAYGPRLRNYDGVDQLAEVIELLRSHPPSRRAVIQLYDHDDWRGGHKDIPCTCTLQFLRRDGRVHVITYMRSNDAYLGLPHDVFCFTMIQEYVARVVGLETGLYTHMVGSLHLYDRNVDAAKEFLAEGYMRTTSPMPAMPEGDPAGGLRELLELERAYRCGTDAAKLPRDPYWADLGRLYAAHAARSGPVEVLTQLKSQMQARCYDIFLQQLIDRIGD